jgi:aryl sulfotransferase
MTPRIYWLASYPKSGNTWMRILLTNYLRNADEPADINSLDGGPIASARQIFDDNVGVEASDLTQDEIERYRPGVYEMISAQATESLFLKVHDAYTYTPDDVPLLSKTATAGALYLIRNPLDVAVSFAHHSASTVERMVRKMGEADFAFVDNPHRLHNQLRQRLLTWSDHVTSWVDEPGLPVHVVRYEDMQADPLATFTDVVRFCGLDDDSVRIAKAVDFSRFDRAQAQETEEGFGEKMPLAKSFFRKGVAGSWREELSEELAAKVLSEHATVMRRFGYLTPDGAPVY